jgi:hypothetical protein
MIATNCNPKTKIPKLPVMLLQYARDVMEQADSYTSAVELFSSNSLINPIYYVVAGSAPSEGAVVTRYREAEKTDVWSINTSAVDGWFRLVTNYDHWETDPTYDDRRTPGIQRKHLFW